MLHKLQLSLFFILIFSCALSLRAQSPVWVDMMHDRNANYYETIDSFDSWWGDREITRGSGYKPFQRWAYHMGLKVDATGSLQTYYNSDLEYLKYLEKNSITKNSVNGNWSAIGPINLPTNGTGQPNGNGRVNAIAFHPTVTNTFFTGSASGGIWKTTNYGSSWTDITNNLATLGVSSIIVDPDNTNQIFIGTGDRDAGDAPGKGVYKTTNGGSTWQSWNATMGNVTVYEVMMDPSNHDVLIASSYNKIWRSTDRGANWSQVFSGHSCKDLAFHPTNPNYVYAVGSKVHRSTDNGASWTEITNGTPTSTQRIALAVSVDEPDWVYLLSGNGSGLEGFYKSTDSGTSFSLQSNTPNIMGYDWNGGSGSQAWYDIVAVADPNDANHIFTGGVNIWETFDGGVNWSCVSHWYGNVCSWVHADQHVLEYHPISGDLFNGNDGGVYFSTNDGATFTEITDGLGISQIYKIGQSQTKKEYVIAGFQDNGTAIYYGSNNWATEVGGDGMECIIDHQNESIMYTALYYGDIRRSTNNGASFSQIAKNGVNGITESGAWVTPYKIHPIGPDTMYIGYKNIWRAYNASSAGSPGWSKISSFSGSYNCIDIEISISNPDVMYVSRSSNEFYKSSNINASNPNNITWTDLTNNLPTSSNIKDIEIDPTDHDHLWITASNDIYESINGGTSWTNVSGTLPNIGANCVVFDRYSPVEAMYIGMDIGVYYIDNTLSDWVIFDNGLPLVEILELEINYHVECGISNFIRAATYGRGVQESDLRDPGTFAPIACFGASDTNIDICDNTNPMISFYDYSAFSPTSWNWVFSPSSITFHNGTNNASQNPLVSFNNSGTYTVTLTSANGNGSDNFVRTDYISVLGESIPHQQNFEAGNQCSTSTNCGATICILPGNWTNLVNGVADDIDWRLDAGGTTSDGTGPSTDYNPGTSSGLYVYTEASGNPVCSSKTAMMESGCFDLTNTNEIYELVFAYHMFGSNMGELHIDAIVDDVLVQDISPVISGDQGNTWHTSTVNLGAYDGSLLKIRIRGITGNGWSSDIAIDNIIVQAASALPVELLSFSATQNASKQVLLDWETSSEINSSHFIIQRSRDAQNFMDLGIIQAQGYSNALKAYSFIDESPNQGSNYYRLKQVDLDDSFTFSIVRLVEFGTSEDLIIGNAIPNPFNQSTTISIHSDKERTLELVLLDHLGREIMQIEKKLIVQDESSIEISKANLPAGLYYLSISDPSVHFIRKLVIF